MIRRLTIPALVLAAFVASAGVRAQGPVETALSSAATYLETVRAQVAGVVLEEKYFQQAVSRVSMARELRADLAVMADADHGWVEFRDVFEVDGKPIRDREDRVVQLFTNPSADALEQAKRIVAEGARFNLDAVGVQFDRTINLPMAALMFLRAENQSRSRFQRDSFDGRRITVLQFEERATPRLIGSADNAPARGRFWIAQETGQVLRTQLEIRSRRGTTNIAARIEVQYDVHPQVGILLPESMEEHYVFTDGMGQTLAAISGRALYSNVRKFRVDVDEQLAAEAEATAP